MAKHLIFLPCSIAESKCGDLYGIVKETKCDKTISVCYFILNVGSSRDQVHQNQDDDSVLIGECINDEQSVLLNIWNPPNPRRDVIQIQVTNEQFKTSFSSNVNQNDKSSPVIVVYDEEVFRHSELLRTDNEHINSHDHFQILGALLRKQSNSNTHKFWDCFQFLWTALFLISSLFLSAVSLAKPVFKYSALWLRLHGFLNSLSWALGSLKNEKKVW